KNADKLESTFMYDSLPIDQIRRASFWAHLKSNDGKKVLIIENADRMNESCRNALLKILEEPPSDVVFILTTTRRGAVMPTILSRVRTYNFTQRTQVQEREVLDRVFHADSDKLDGGITNHLNNFLPVKADAILQAASRYYDGIKNGHLIQIDELVKECAGFEPRILFKLFLQSLMQVFRVQNPSPAQIEYEEKNVECIRECYNNVTIYNQTPLSALENLYRDLAYNKKICLG
ncbi:MAG: DNA polymerase III, partial [Treponema sp.]|nr:DNA polymerase III [Treponema sp.]